MKGRGLGDWKPSPLRRPPPPPFHLIRALSPPTLSPIVGRGPPRTVLRGEPSDLPKRMMGPQLTSIDARLDVSSRSVVASAGPPSSAPPRAWTPRWVPDKCRKRPSLLIHKALCSPQFSTQEAHLWTCREASSSADQVQRTAPELAELTDGPTRLTLDGTCFVASCTGDQGRAWLRRGCRRQGG